MPARSGRRHTLKMSDGSTTYVGGGRRVYRKSSNMKKTTKKGAYNPARKKQMMIRRAPFVETKSRTHEDVYTTQQITIDPTEFNIIPNVDTDANPQTIVNLPVWSIHAAQQGLGEDQMIGLSCYGKYLKAKLQFKLPDGQYSITHPADVYLVHGFIKAPFGRTSFTNPTAQNTTHDDLQGWIKRHLKDFFDEREDKLRFIPRQNTNLRILGYRQVKPNRNANLGVEAIGNNQGTYPMINMSCYWPVKRKLYYSPGKGALPPGTANNQFLFMNTQHLPFMCVYNPTAAQFTAGTDYCLRVAYNDAFWYSDS